MELPEPILLAIVEALGHGDRTRLAMVCKALLHAQFGKWRAFAVTLGEDWATSVKYFRRCLKLHPNRFTTKIFFRGQRPTATSDNPCVFDIPFGQLGSLTSLNLGLTAVHLPSLLCIARQLRSLTLRYIPRLCTGASPGAQSSIFAAGWDSLRHLEMDRVCVDAAFGAVHLPSLVQLCLLRVRVGDAHGAEHFCADAFAVGCPRCTKLEYSQPLPFSPTAGMLCKDFLRVQQLALDLRHFENEIEQMSKCKWPALPATISSLRFPPDEDSECLELLTMLAVTAAWISDGVPLQQLYFCGYAPCESDLAPVNEQQQQSVVGRYGAVCASLCGITRLHLLRSGCSLRLRNAMVAALPDLQQLSMDIDVDTSEDLPIPCSGLDLLELTLTFQDYGNHHVKLGINLGDANTLRTCVIHLDGTRLEGGKHVEVHIVGLYAAASIVPSVEIVRDGGGSACSARLMISLDQGSAQPGTRRAAHVEFTFGHELGEEASMEGSQSSAEGTQSSTGGSQSSAEFSQSSTEVSQSSGEDAIWRALPVHYY